MCGHFITNHCDENRGDLFVSPGSCATVMEVSESLATLRDILIICPQFMGALLPNDFATFLHGKEVTVWMMSCGALVSSPNSYAELAAQVQWLLRYPRLYIYPISTSILTLISSYFYLDIHSQ